MTANLKKQANRKSNHLKQIIKMAYLFGCYSRADMSRLFMVGEETLNREYGELQDIFSDMEQIQIPRVGNEREMVLFRDRLQKGKPECIRAYASVSVSETVKMQCSVLEQVLKRKKTLTASEFLVSMQESGAYDSEEDGDEDTSDALKWEKNRRRNNMSFLEMMCDLGYLERSSKRKNREKVYVRPDTIGDTFSEGEKQELAGFLDYAVRVNSPSFFGYQLLQRLPKPAPVFTYTRSLEYMVLDEERLLEIQELAEKYPLIEIDFVKVERGQSGWLAGRDRTSEAICPWAFLLDRKYGRSYLIGYLEKCDQMIAVPLERIGKLTGMKGTLPPKEKMEQAWNRQYGNVWLAGGRPAEMTESLRVSLLLEAKHIKTHGFRLEHEGITACRNGHITADKEGNLLYEIVTDNWMDMVPWIRSFGGALRVERAAGIESGKDYGKEIRGYLKEMWEEARRKYDQT